MSRLVNGISAIAGLLLFSVILQYFYNTHLHLMSPYLPKEISLLDSAMILLTYNIITIFNKSYTDELSALIRGKY